MQNASLFSSVGASGKTAAILNVVVMIVIPMTWFLPLLKSSAFIFIRSEVSIWSGAAELLESDIFLFLVVVVFAMLMPLVKCVIYLVIWFGARAERKALLWFGSAAAKLSMTDVFLVALVIVSFKGLKVGKIEALPGLYVFAVAVIASSLISIFTDRQSHAEIDTETSN